MIIDAVQFGSAYRGAFVFSGKKPLRAAVSTDYVVRESKVKDSVTGEDKIVQAEDPKKDVDVGTLKQFGVGVFGGGYDSDAMCRDLDREDLVLVRFDDRVEMMTR